MATHKILHGNCYMQWDSNSLSRYANRIPPLHSRRRPHQSRTILASMQTTHLPRHDPITTVIEALQFTTLLPASTTINPEPIITALQQADSGCTGIVRVNGTWKPCNRPVVALRHWQPNEQHTGETIGGVCKTHAHHNIIPLTILAAINNVES